MWVEAGAYSKKFWLGRAHHAEVQAGGGRRVRVLERVRVRVRKRVRVRAGEGAYRQRPRVLFCSAALFEAIPRQLKRRIEIGCSCLDGYGHPLGESNPSFQDENLMS